MSKTIHFIAQDEGSLKALLPVHALSAAWPAVETRFYCIGRGLEFLARRQVAGREFPARGLYPSPDDVPDLIVAGASMWDSIEKQAIAGGRALGIPSLVIVDHGSNFWGRFSASGDRDLSALPDRILAPDEESRENMGKAGFPTERIVVTGNPYFDSFHPGAGSGAASGQRVILCVMQPEFRAGRYRSDDSWLPMIRELAEEFGPRAKWIVRPHPKEEPRAYLAFKEAGIEVDETSDITDLILRSDIVIGKNSTSLIEAVFRGRAVISLDRGDGQWQPLPTQGMGLSALARSAGELRAWIAKCLSPARPLAELKQVRYYNDGGNCGRAAACVLEMLWHAAPAAARAAPPGRIRHG